VGGWVGGWVNEWVVEWMSWLVGWYTNQQVETTTRKSENRGGSK